MFLIGFIKILEGSKKSRLIKNYKDDVDLNGTMSHVEWGNALCGSAPSLDLYEGGDV